MTEGSGEKQENQGRMMSRRTFLRLPIPAAVTAALTWASRTSLPEEFDSKDEEVVVPRESREKLQFEYKPALLIDIPPLPEELKRLQEAGSVNPNTKPFDIDGFFQKHAGVTYQELVGSYSQRTESDEYYPDRYVLVRNLLNAGKEKEAIMIAFSFQAAEHGFIVGNIGRYFREEQNKKARIVDSKPEGMSDEDYLNALMKGEIQTETRDVTPYPLEPYEILSIQDYIESIEKADDVDEFGNPYYDIMIDHERLARDLSRYLKDKPHKILNFSLNLSARIRIGYKLPVGHLPEDITKNNPEGWLEDAIVDSNWVEEEGMVTYEYPPIALETGYQNNEGLNRLKEFANTLPGDVILVAASGNSRAEIPADFELPGNCILVSTYYPQGNESGIIEPRPRHGFFGRNGTPIYINELMSSLGASVVSEWLVEQKVKDPQSASRLLNDHSMIHIPTGLQIVDYGTNPYNFDFSDKRYFHPVQEERNE